VNGNGKSIALIGMPGCGKTTVGQVLAQKLGFAFIDTDRDIEEREGTTVSEIFAQKGEEAFRVLETQALRRAVARDRAVIAAGGGAVLREENRKILRSRCRVVYLQRDLPKILQNDLGDRPLLAARPETLYALYGQRRELYESCAHVTVTHEREAEETAENIQNAIKNGRGTP